MTDARHVAIHHRLLDVALEFSAEMNRRTQGKVAPGDLPWVRAVREHLRP